MIQYHGTPIGSATVCLEVVGAGHGFVSFAASQQLGVVAEFSQSFAIDNGAFTAWKAGRPIKDWRPFYEWADEVRKIPSCDFAVVPDVIDGTEEDNDALLAEWPFSRFFGAPVWHMHESLDRLERLSSGWPRVCLGSSGEFSRVGGPEWRDRMDQVMEVLCDKEGYPATKLHGLRMLNPQVFCDYPFASADSTNIGRNVGIDSAWKGTYLPPTKEARAAVMRSRVEAFNAPTRWKRGTP
jgi:hypothetical protein